ncbi:MAG: response regulator transcription factor, partial [Opitutales bacterium]
AIRSAIRGEHYVSPALSKFVFRRAKKSKSFRKEHKGLSLTPTELKVLRGIAHGQTSQEIASELGVSYRTITTHRNNISQKLNLTGNHPLLNFALSNKSSILSLPE